MLILDKSHIKVATIHHWHVFPYLSVVQKLAFHILQHLCRFKTD